MTGISGVRHEGNPAGSSKKIGETDAYFAYPENKSTDKAILFLTDAFGHNFINNKLVADDFANNGFVTTSFRSMGPSRDRLKLTWQYRGSVILW